MLKMSFLKNEEFLKLYNWKDNNKDIVRNNKFTPFEEGKIDFLEKKLRLYYKCDLKNNNIKLVVSLFTENGSAKYVETVAQFNNINYGYQFTKTYSYKQNKYISDGEEIALLIDLVTFVKSINAYSLYNYKEIKHHYTPKEKSIKDDNNSLDKKISVHTKSLTRYVNTSDSELKQSIKEYVKTKRKTPSEPFIVRGFVRRYKNGKTIYIKPFIKCANGVNKEEIKLQNVVYKL